MNLKNIFPFQPSKTEFKLFIFYTLFVMYGSLYPFKFHFQEYLLKSGNIISFLFCNFNFHTSIGDIVTNFLLFIPFGFLGVRSMRSPFNPPYYTLVITLICILIAHSLQVLQFFVEGRVPSLIDTFFNVFGSFLAGAFGAVSRFRFIGGKRGEELWKSKPFVLLICWIAYNTIPFVPTLDFGDIKNSLKPLLLHPKLDMITTLKYTMGWLLFFYMYKEHTGKTLNIKSFSLIIIITLLARIFIETRVLGLPQVIGSTFALFLTKYAHKKIYNPRLLFISLISYLTIYGLWPFKLSRTPIHHFYFLPFYGFLEGQLFVTAYTAIKKMFFYGCVIWTMERSKIKWAMATFICISWATSLEVAQIWLSDHTPEITDPLIMLLMAIWIKKTKPTTQISAKVVYYGLKRRKNRLKKFHLKNLNNIKTLQEDIQSNAKKGLPSQ